MAKGSWTEHPKAARLRRRWKSADLLARVLDNFRVHRTGRNAALVAHYGFLSVFPLMLVFTTVLGWVLESRPKLQETIVDSAFNRLPFIGQQIASNPGELEGNLVVFVFGLLATLWAGMRAFNMLQIALDDIIEVPIDKRPNLFRTRVRSLIGIAIVGGGQISAAVLGALVAVTGVPVIHKVALAFAAVVMNTVVIGLTYRWLCAKEQTWRRIAPGAIAAGVVFAGLQLAGTAIVGRAIANASPVYGTFATVIGLITWLALHSTVALLGAELNHALPTRRFTS